jgi:hypothetical protein
MGVYIKGMEMPTSCSVCPMLEGDRLDGLCHAASKWLDDDEHWTWFVFPEGDMDDSKPCNCPLIPVPPHGRLGDLDALMRHCVMLPMDGGRLLVVYASYVSNAPTIIPAEEEER